jgi:hypothetical protein
MTCRGEGSREEVPAQMKGLVMLLVTGATGTIGCPWSICSSARAPRAARLEPPRLFQDLGH